MPYVCLPDISDSVSSMLCIRKHCEIHFYKVARPGLAHLQCPINIITDTNENKQIKQKATTKKHEDYLWSLKCWDSKFFSLQTSPTPEPQWLGPTHKWGTSVPD